MGGCAGCGHNYTRTALATYPTVSNLFILPHDQSDEGICAATGLFDERLMKLLLMVFAGLCLGLLGGAALGLGAGLAWTSFFHTSDFEGYSGMLVFFTFMPLGAAIGGLGGALLFGVIAVRDAEIALEREPARRRER